MPCSMGEQIPDARAGTWLGAPVPAVDGSGPGASAGSRREDLISTSDGSGPGAPPGSRREGTMSAVDGSAPGARAETGHEAAISAVDGSAPGARAETVRRSGNDRPRVAVTMGDPAGVGPEICLRVLADAETARSCVPVVFGDAEVLRRVARELGLPFGAQVMGVGAWEHKHREVRIPTVVHFGGLDAAVLRPGVVDATCGDAAFRYVIGSIDAALLGQVDGVATAPLNKAALHAAGHLFPGHTEIFAEKMRARRSCMMLTSAELTCSFVTVHVGYHEVPALLRPERILDVIELTAEAMRRIRGAEPKLAVCGLNPHAGEDGLFGRREEEELIVPAIDAARRSGLDVVGPIPADTAFITASRRSRDAFICMYHDQGHIPMKVLAFDSAINTTLGLPVVRTSVDHGTAFDIAWQGKANPSSLFEAVRLAARLSGR
jgi:4-phospho-D-threonate 3-dehydrogenase / 4-phospho-D-erythronate 3-dehydrogenase